MEDKVTPAVTAQVQRNVRQTDVAVTKSVIRLIYSVTQGAILAYHVEISKNLVCNMWNWLDEIHEPVNWTELSEVLSSI